MERTDAGSIRPRGRPRGARNLQRGHLLSAARALLASQPLQDLNLREVAKIAGVTPALAHYYFGNRDGLIEALFAEQVAARIEELMNAARSRAAQPQQALTYLMQRMCALLASDPLLRRCLWLPLPAAMQVRAKLHVCVRELLAQAQDMRTLRADLPADYLADALLGLVMFPFLDDTAADAGTERVAQLMLQHIALLRDGILPAGMPHHQSLSS